MRKYKKSEYRKYTNRYSHPIKNITQLNDDYQRRDRARFAKNKRNRQNAGAIRKILYRED
jgi:hypothetical protein